MAIWRGTVSSQTSTEQEVVLTYVPSDMWQNKRRARKVAELGLTNRRGKSTSPQPPFFFFWEDFNADYKII
jgi:hypothetical protein